MQLAFLYPVPRTTMKPGPHWGAPFVAREFFRALFHHAPYSDYLFFAARQADVAERRQALAEHWGITEGIESHHVLDLPEVLAEESILALHGMGNHLHQLAYARSLVPEARFPVTTSAASSPSYHWSLPEHGQDLAAGLRPGDTMVCMTDAARQVHQELFAHVRQRPLAGWSGPLQEPNLVTIPLGIDSERYRPGLTAGWRTRLQLPDDAFVVTSLGRLSPTDKADLQPVLRAFFHGLNRDDPQARPIYLVIAGSDYQDHARELGTLAAALGIADRVRLVVDPPEGEKPALLAESDCFLALPDNPQEAFGYSVLEALACGLPVVAADWDGLKETVSAEVGFRVPTCWGPALQRLDQVSPLFHRHEDEQMHLLAAQSVAVDVTAAWERVRQLRDDAALHRQMAAAARQRVESVYAWPHVIAQYVEMWAAAAEHAREHARTDTGATLHWPTAFQTAFRHYPTHWLGPDTVIERLPPQPVPPAAAIRPYPDVKPALSPGFLDGLLRALDAPKPIGELIARSGAEADVVYYHLLWLIKQGIVRAVVP